MTRLLIRFSGALLLGAASALPAFAQGKTQKRHIIVTAVEPKGGATVDEEPFPARLPDGKGYVLKEPDSSGRWEVAVYVFDPRQIFVNQGDEVTLEFVGINGASHPTTIAGYDKSFDLRRGEVRRLTFTADRTGVFRIVCAAHHPTMVAELVVSAKK